MLKALCLGAHAVLLGRPLVHALACGGAMGVARMLALLRDETVQALVLAGAHAPGQRQPGLLASG